MPKQDEVESINASLKQVGVNLSAYRESTDRSLTEFAGRIQSVEQTVAKGGGVSQPAGAGPNIGATAVQQITEDGSYRAAAEQASRGMKVSRFDARVNVDGSIRAALTNGGNGNTGDTAYPTWSERRPGVYGPVIPAPRLLDVLPSRKTSSDAVEYIKLSVTGDAAEQEHEGDPKAELDFEGDLETASIVTVAGWTTASKQVLGDAAGLQAAINRTINLKVLSRLENRIINGPGGQGKINGLLNQAPVFNPTIGVTPVDVIGEALTLLNTNGYQPNLVVINPLDFFKYIQIVKNEETGEYLFGDPTSPQGAVIWNTVVVPTPAMPNGRVLVLDTSVTTVLDREQMSIAISNSHADYFIRNLVAILGELRAGLEVIDTNAMLQVTMTPQGS